MKQTLEDYLFWKQHFLHSPPEQWRKTRQADLIKASVNGDVDLAEKAVLFGADVNKIDYIGKCSFHPPLLYASRHGCLKMVVYLVQNGALLDKTSGMYQVTALFDAVEEENLDIVRFLLEQGADVNKADYKGWTPLHCGVHMNEDDGDIAMLLMSYGADLHAKTHCGKLPIDLACTEAMKQAIRNEPRRRMDHGYKRATEHMSAFAMLSNQRINQDNEQNDEQSNKRLRTDDGAIETKTASEDEDSEPSDNEDDEYA